MINKNKYVELMLDGRLKLFRAGKYITPVNAVELVDGGSIYFRTNNGIACMDIEIYLKRSYWAHCITYDHKGPGVLAYHNGVEHKSIPADIMGTSKKDDEYVGYYNGDRMDCRRKNLYVFHRKVA